MSSPFLVYESSVSILFFMASRLLRPPAVRPVLMSITERFTEIATLKCLGATDWFILIQIVLESLMQGIAGGIAGIFLGSLAAACANLFSAGTRLAGAWDWYALGGAALWALAAGTVLSILAAIYPACKAAAMAPMEAMRVQ